MIVLHSFQERLIGELVQIEEGILGIWRRTEITEFRNDPNSAVVFIVHPYYWKELPIQHRAEQARLLGQYRHWYELFSRCHAQHSSDVQDNLAKISEYISTSSRRLSLSPIGELLALLKRTVYNLHVKSRVFVLSCSSV